MEVIEIYAITFGCFLSLIVLGKYLARFVPWSTINLFFNQHFVYPYVLGRHSFLGPWTRLGTFMHLSYVSIIAFILFFKSNSAHTLGRRAGSLALINLVFLVASFSLSRTADLLGISLKTSRRAHRAVGWIVFILSAIHVSITVIIESEAPAEAPNRIFGIVVSYSSMASTQPTNETYLKANSFRLPYV